MSYTKPAINANKLTALHIAALNSNETVLIAYC